MRIDVTPLISGKIQILPFSYAFSLDELDDCVLAPDDVTFPHPIQVSGTVRDNGGLITLSAQAAVDYQTACARCLKPIEETFVLDFDRTAVASGTLADPDSDDYVIIEDGFLDIDRELAEAMMLAFPSRFLCDEACPGLCPQCGHPLAEGPCSCNKKEIDPRLAILQKLLDLSEDL